MITAKFIGKDDSNCNFIHNKIYDIDLKTFESYIWVMCDRTSSCCPYSSLETLSKNWIIPLNPLGKYGG